MPDLRHQQVVFGAKQKTAILFKQLEPSIPAHIVANIMKDVARHIVLAVLMQDINHLFRAHTRRAGIPEREGGQTIGVDMFRTLDQLAKCGQLIAAGFIPRVVHFKQYGAVGLDDKRIVGVVH